MSVAKLLFDRLDRLLRRGFLDGAGQARGEAVELHRALQRLDLGGDLLELLFDGRVLAAAAPPVSVRKIEQSRLGELALERMLPGRDLGERVVDGDVALGAGWTLAAAQPVELAVDPGDRIGKTGAAVFLRRGRGGGGHRRMAGRIIPREGVEPPI